MNFIVSCRADVIGGCCSRYSL